ncbi:phage major capsid protein [Faecalibaculum rodentium]|uniref:phage major capsid protein n=1 Tax=Faecalibaculum rodentium TaxID=1702221 RepID=UPI00272B4FD3|nr:phage major capsid protein [Faecalibaculum rodentium]
MKLEKTNLQEAMESKDITKLESAIADIAQEKAEAILEAAVKDSDARILKARGARELTSKETKFYETVIEALKSKTREGFKSAITGIDVVMPETIIDTVFDDLTTNHELISHLDVIRTKAKIKVHFANMGTVKKATWGDVDGTITTEISGGFTELDAGAYKLSCWMPVPNSMIDLGPSYLDRFTRTLLYEALANGVEDGTVNGLTSAAPYGMIVDLSKNGTTSDGVTTYPAKTAMKITDWTPKGLSAAIKALQKTKNGNYRNVTGRLFMVVNPDDYVSIVKPAICVQNGMGEWVDRSPYAISIVKSPFVPEGKAVLGIDKQYALALCSNSIDGNLEYDDSYKFLEEVRTFKIKLYGNGRPKDDNSFIYLDISGLKEAQLLVTNVTNNVQAGA